MEHGLRLVDGMILSDGNLESRISGIINGGPIERFPLGVDP